MEGDNQVVSWIVEMDETYIGDKETNKHKDKKSLTGFSSKTPIIGMKKRKGKIIANVESNTTKKTLFKNIYNHIGMNSLITQTICLVIRKLMKRVIENIEK